MEGGLLTSYEAMLSDDGCLSTIVLCRCFFLLEREDSRDFILRRDEDLACLDGSENPPYSPAAPGAPLRALIKGEKSL